VLTARLLLILNFDPAFSEHGSALNMQITQKKFDDFVNLWDNQERLLEKV